MRPPVTREVDDEIAFHLEMTTRELIAAGMSPDNARVEAMRRFGDRLAVSAECRALSNDRARRVRRAEIHVEMKQDLVFAARQLTRAKGFTAVAIATLALGIGATTTVFSALYAVALKPLPFPDAGRVVMVTSAVTDESSSRSPAEFLAMQARTDAFEHVAAAVETGFTITDGDVPELVGGSRVSAEYFDVFAARPLVGRAFARDEDSPGKERVVVLSHGLWVSRFNSDQSVVNRTMHMNGEVYTIIGVMPAAFAFTRGGEDLWVPLALGPQERSEKDAHYLEVVGRMKAGVSQAQATSAATAAVRAVAATITDRRVPVAQASVTTKSFVDVLAGDYKRQLLILLGAVGFVLLIACTNVANLMLARGAARDKEFAIRASLGAGRARLVRQLLTESVLLAGVGAALGVAVAFALLGLLLRVSPEGVPRLDQAQIDWRVLVFALGAAVVCSIIVGLVPAIRAGRTQLQGTLREGGRNSAAGGRGPLRAILVGAEVAMAMMLLTGAGLLLRSAWLAQRIEPGFDSRGVMTARVLFPSARYSDPASIVTGYNAIHREAAAIPGVSAAALVSVVPLSGSRMNAGISRDRLPGEGDAEPLSANLRLASTGYFATMRIPLRAGRDIATTDDARSAPIIVLNETLARKLWPGVPLKDVVGRRVSTLAAKRSELNWMLVAGIVADIHDASLTGAVEPEFYIPFAQAPAMIWPFLQQSMVVVVRARNEAADVEALTKPLAKAVATIDPSLPLADPSPMTAYLRGSLETARFNTLLLSTLGIIALLLAMVGVYGVVAYFVAQRTNEIGVRMALGATPGGVWRLVVQRGLTPIVVGVIVGGAASLATSGVLRGQLYGVSSNDPATLAAVALVLILVSLIATYAPARRAMRVSPIEALSG